MPVKMQHPISRKDINILVMNTISLQICYDDPGQPCSRFGLPDILERHKNLISETNRSKLNMLTGTKRYTSPENTDHRKTLDKIIKIMDTVPITLKKFRDDMELSQIDVGKLVGTSGPIISNIEYGFIVSDLDLYLVRLSKLYGQSFDTIKAIFGKGLKKERAKTKKLAGWD